MPEQINVIGKYKTKTAVAQPNRMVTKYVVIHHAAWTYDPGDALQSIFTYHSSQWPQYGRIGYNEVIQEERDGTLQRYLVNPYDMVGAGVWGRNPECFHICMARHNLNEIPPQHWIDETAHAAADAKRRFPNAQIVGHGEIALPGHETSCPGSKWKAWKPAFVAQVDNLIKRATPPPDPWLAWGTMYPLPPEQRQYGISTLWFQHRAALKEARSYPWYPSGAQGIVIQVFQGGLIWCVDGQCQVKQFARVLS
jgi:hypothetical protein